MADIISAGMTTEALTRMTWVCANDGSVQAFTELLALKEKGLTTMTAEEDESTINQLFADGKVGNDDLFPLVYQTCTRKTELITDMSRCPIMTTERPAGRWEACLEWWRMPTRSIPTKRTRF